MHIRQKEGVHAEFDKLPKSRNRHRKEESAKGAKGEGNFRIFAKESGQVCAEHGKQHACKGVKNVVPPRSRVIQIVGIAKQRTHRIHHDEQVHNSFQAELEQLLPEYGQEYVHDGYPAH